MAEYPTEAVAVLQAWTTSNYDQLATGAVIQQFDVLARNYSLVVTFQLEAATEIQSDIDYIAGLKSDAQDDRDAVAAALTAATASADAASGSATAAAGYEADALAAASAAENAAQDLSPADIAFLFAQGGPVWLEA